MVFIGFGVIQMVWLWGSSNRSSNGFWFSSNGSLTGLSFGVLRVAYFFVFGKFFSKIWAWVDIFASWIQIRFLHANPDPIFYDTEEQISLKRTTILGRKLKLQSWRRLWKLVPDSTVTMSSIFASGSSCICLKT